MSRFACIFYFIARAEGYGVSNSWIGRSIDRFEGQPQSVVYIYALYLSVASFAGLGDQDFYSNSPAESIAMAIYLLFNVVLGAYILGTVTMVSRGATGEAERVERVLWVGRRYCGEHDNKEAEQGGWGAGFQLAVHTN